MHLLFLCFSELTLTENGDESITENGQEPIVQVSLRDLPVGLTLRKEGHIYKYFKWILPVHLTNLVFLVYSRFTHMRAYQN